MQTKLIIISSLLQIPLIDINKSIEAITIRNIIIHKGILIEKDHYEILQGLFRTISKINHSIYGIELKIPPFNNRFQTKMRII
jgi:hypothetical protein